MRLEPLLLLALATCARACGGYLRAQTGLIQTPDFPAPFPAPLACRWVIENAAPNGSISIYFTQQYTTTGLSFTEYLYYDETYKAGERRALTVTEDNITRVKYLQVTSPFLVVELQVPRLEGTQLRAAGLLDLFGLNITYEARGPGAGLREACSAIECRLLGHCYATADYSSFYCACFEGYSGPDCGTGPLCPANTETCKNGGTCRQLGIGGVNCLCAPGYTGDLCEILEAPPECRLEECMEGCRSNRNCDCNPRENDANSARYDTKLQIVDTPMENLTEHLLQQITAYLRSYNITMDEEVEILNISKPEATPSSDGQAARTVRLRIWGPRREAGSVRAALARLAASRARLPGVALLPAALQFDMQPALALASVTSTSRHEVWQGAEFILSCMAYGSSETAFTWYKDGVKIRLDRTERDIWTRTVSEDALGRRLGVLGVGRAVRQDAGAWACAARDAGRTRCRALRMAVVAPPTVKLIPSAVTLQKGDNGSITCTAMASGRVHGVLGFSWARGRSLLPLTPGREVWEDLYPVGSVLKLYNVQKSTEYTCQVSSVAGTASVKAQVWVAGAAGVCRAGAAMGKAWAATAAGTSDVADCPHGYKGQATRYCQPMTTTHGVMWSMPDFSDCLANTLGDIYDQFVRISYGYSGVGVGSAVASYGAALRALRPLPGAGARPLAHARAMLAYARAPPCASQDRAAAVEPLAGVFDTLLGWQDAFMDEQKVYELQSSLVDLAYLRPHLDLRLPQFHLQSLQIREDTEPRFRFAANLSRWGQQWGLVSASVELLERTRTMNLSLVMVYYRDLEGKLPSLRRAVEFRPEGELGYNLVSRHVQLGSVGSIEDSSGMSLNPTVILVHKNIHNLTVSGSRFACGVRTASEPGAWDTRACEVRTLDKGQILCRCRGVGTYGLFYLDRALRFDESRSRTVVSAGLVTGGVLGLAAAVLQLQRLLSGVTPGALLRAACCAAHAGALAALLQCDTASACANGWWGGAVAGCWILAGMALALQPLLLQDELAGRAQRLHLKTAILLTVGCGCMWTVSVVHPSAPLSLREPPVYVTLVTTVSLAVMFLTFALDVLSRLRAVSQKIPGDRRSYVKSRVVTVRGLLVLQACYGVTHVAGILYVQPELTHVAFAVTLAACAIATGICMIVCYGVRQTDCGHWRQLTSLKQTDWEHGSDTGNTSLSLFIKRGRETESRGSVSSPPQSAASYWRAPTPDSPTHSSSPDNAR